MKHLHDLGYKKLFQNPTIFRELIESFVHEEWVRALDFETCETLDKSFIADHYKATESDLIYKLRLHGQDAYVVILLEFQSTVDRFMALRILNYMTAFYLDYVQSHKRAQKLPPLFPIVLYRGKRPWTAPARMSELIDNYDLLGRFAVQFEYCQIAEQNFSQTELLRIGNIVSTVFLTEMQYEPALLVEECGNLFDREDQQAFGLFMNWLLNLTTHGRMASDEYAQIMQQISSKEEVKAMLLTSLQDYYERAAQDAAQKLEHEIEQKIKLESKLESKLEIARTMLLKGLTPTLIAELTGLPETVIARVNAEDLTTLVADISRN